MARGKASYSEAFTKKIGTELFLLTYGALVAQLIQDYEDNDEINTQLDKMGYNIGLRLADDFLARHAQSKCVEFRETADIIAKFGFKTYLGLVPLVDKWNPSDRSCCLVFDHNPLAEFVELPPEHASLWYANILCGVLRGALEVVHLEVEVKFLQDVLRGDDRTELYIRCVRKIEDTVPPGED
eukprot:TRINITY_DN3240_c3_g1_i1.p1 TRINITY_DN3240_c3_g1~~TRINITY_DN3240_c3_g1_i1.p1  ORF type:complete len:193 (+),score=58.74 TRINITY_DN3240_c3_g1_i1:31-579(+)